MKKPLTAFLCTLVSGSAGAAGEFVIRRGPEGKVSHLLEHSLELPRITATP